jgi:hypothetical protein
VDIPRNLGEYTLRYLNIDDEILKNATYSKKYNTYYNIHLQMTLNNDNQYLVRCYTIEREEDAPDKIIEGIILNTEEESFEKLKNWAKTKRLELLFEA